ncbi:hypothetical protein VKT23_014556 [Stygiomarasmius scandens]|uniref:RBR-type E3 ubiquitin transferase n=1 Tax=Marasmiellus scandens TaxID=2682957 RepID=A0ABR1J0M2_9AGAR
MSQSLQPTPTPLTISKELQTCPFFLKGKCRYGEKCRKSHVRVEAPRGEAVNAPTQNTASINTATGSLASPTNTCIAQNPTKPCFSWAKGSCTRGDKCKYLHNPEAIIKDERQDYRNEGDGRRDSETSGFKASTAKKRRGAKNRATAQEHEAERKEAEEISRREAEAGRLKETLRKAQQRKAEEAAERERQRVEAERIRHEAEAKRLREEAQRIEAERRKAEQAAERERKRKEEERRAEELRVEEEARREEKDRLDAAVSIQHLVLGSTIVKFSAGIAIDRIITGFDSCRIRVSNLPLDAKPYEANNLLLDQGMEREMFQFVNLKTWRGKKEANFIVEKEWGRAIALGIDGIDFRGEPLTVEASDSGTLEGMNCNSSGILSVTWRIPSERFVVTYLSASEASAKRSVMDGRILNGRKIKVENNRLRGSNRSDPCSLLVFGLPLGTSTIDIQEWFDTSMIRKLPNSILYNEALAEDSLKQHVRTIMNGGSVEFEPSQLNATQGNRSLRLQFKSWEDAKKVHDHLVDKKFAFIGNSTFRLWLPDPYQITVSVQQYHSQKKQWDSFADDTRGRKDSTLHVRVLVDKVILRVGGEDLKAVGMLKVRVENLVAGTVLQDISHVWFGSAAGQKFLESVCSETGAYIKHDWRLKMLKAFGDEICISKAREMMKEEMARLSDLEHTETLTRKSIRFFVQRGVDALKEAFGEDSVTLDISASPVRITIRGGEDARHLLRKLIDESLLNTTTNFSNTSESSCPVCLMEVSNPVRLGCGHEYCTACIRHFFTADIKNFPIVCVAEDGNCLRPVALPMIQKFLTPSQFSALLETAFTVHIEKNPQLYRYCKTPDCKQIYRWDSSTTATARQCPSCLASVCLKCHEEGHDGMSCEERRVQTDPAEQERLNAAWARGAGVKRCPQCQVWIEKTEGCNHMSCKCGAHICWVCMGTFTAGTIYDHMSQAHGGFYAQDHPIMEEDIPAQVQALRAYENRAQRVPRLGGMVFDPNPNYHYPQNRHRGLFDHDAGLEGGQAERERMRRLEDNRRLAELVAQQRREAEERARRAEERNRLNNHQREQEQERQGGWCVLM